MTFIHSHLDVILLVLTYIVATCGYKIGKGVTSGQLKSDNEMLLKENAMQMEIIGQLRLSQIRTSGNHPAGTQRHLVSVREVDTR